MWRDIQVFFLFYIDFEMFFKHIVFLVLRDASYTLVKYFITHLHYVFSFQRMKRYCICVKIVLKAAEQVQRDCHDFPTGSNIR